MYLGWLVGWLVVFYDISTIMDYLMLNPVYTYDFKLNSLLVSSLCKWKLIVCKQMVSTTVIVCTQLNGLMYCYLLFAHS